MKYNKYKCDCIIDNKIFDICENQWEYFFQKPNVVGVALGYKIIKNFLTNQKCITVFVRKKVSQNILREYEMIPSEYKGFKTDVRQIGIITPQSLTQRIRPVLQGYSIGTEFEGGTTGCIVTDGVDWYVLSNNHVLADENRAPIGSKIIQPSPGDGGNFQNDVIAELSKYVKLKCKTFFRTPTNYVDCAIGKVADKSIVSPEIALVGNIQGIAIAKLSEFVMKVGKTTELTKGIVVNINATILEHYKYENLIFKKQIVTSNMTKKGDSGSILLNNFGYALGLINGSSDEASTASPIHMVLKELGVNIVTN